MVKVKMIRYRISNRMGFSSDSYVRGNILALKRLVYSPEVTAEDGEEFEVREEYKPKNDQTFFG